LKQQRPSNKKEILEPLTVQVSFRSPISEISGAVALLIGACFNIDSLDAKSKPPRIQNNTANNNALEPQSRGLLLPSLSLFWAGSILKITIGQAR
jgi:hypothetical protein